MEEKTLHYLNKLLDELGINAKQFSEILGFIRADRIYNVLNFKNNLSPDLADIIVSKYPKVNRIWLITGKGEMLKDKEEELRPFLVRLLPVSAQGGSLNDFVTSVKPNDCEMIVSPLKDAELSITVSGDSMYPEYPSGSKILIKKINPDAFIDWGRCYVLDTCNGIIVKKLAAPEENDEEFGMNYVTCISVNKDAIFKPFRVSTNDIYGYYRVLMLLADK